MPPLLRFSVQRIGSANQAGSIAAIAPISIGPSWSAPIASRDILEIVTIGGAQTIRWSDRISSLEVGKATDLVMLDGRTAHLFPVQHLPTELVRYASRTDSTSVMVIGKLLIDNREYTTLDLEKLAFQAEGGA